MKYKLLLFIIPYFFAFNCSSQITDKLYIPVTVTSPLFSQSNEIQLGAAVNNFGLNYNFAGQYKNKILILSLQHNTGQIEFNPLNFNSQYVAGEETYLIQTKPSAMLYFELGFGYNLRHETQKISLLAGVGQQFQNQNTRFFVQFDWGKEGRLINAGVSVRGNYTTVGNHQSLFTLEPAVQVKIKIWNFRIINQFAYSLALKKNEDYSAAILTVGVVYIVRKRIK